MRLQDLRQYFVSFLPQLDVHPAVAQKLARYAAIATTMNIYTSVEDSLKKQAMARLHEALTAVPEKDENAVGVPSGVQGAQTLRLVR